MAIRVRAQLRKWFGRGMYPTAEQFSDLFDSFFHKTEDKIPMSGVEGLTDQLNGKYNTAEGRELEKKVQKVTDDLSFQQDGILGGKCLRRIDRKLCPGLDCHFCCHSVNSFRGLNIG